MPSRFVLPGKVYLVGAAGAGAGSDVFNPRAAELLRHAEVVLHDDQVSPKILALVPASTFVQNVGKRLRAEQATPEEIRERMIEFARQGRTVVRLKSDDAPLMADAQKEMQALRAAGIEFEVVAEHRA